MHPILKYHLIQFLHFWKNLGFRLKAEFVIFALIFFSFFTDKINQIFSELLSKPETTEIGLSSFILHPLIAISAISAPFILLYLFPKQRNLKILQSYALNSTQTFLLLIIHYLKYQLIGLLVFFPVFLALFLSAGSIAAIYFLFFLTGFSILFFLLAYYLTWKNNKPKYLFLYFFTFSIYAATFSLFYYYNSNFVFFDILILSLGLIFCYFKWKKCWYDWDIVFCKFEEVAKTDKKVFNKINYFTFKKIFPGSIQPLLIKEVMSYLRNRNYIFLKIITLIIYLLILTFALFFAAIHFETLTAVISLLLIWEHYSHQFNEKYVQRESPVFFRTMPFRFHQIWIAKFFSELFYILLIIFIAIIFLIIKNISLIEIANIGGLITLAAIFILSIITSVKLLFYDNPRLAGYAYHFLVIFCVVMIFNFYLVGPIITLFILLYLNFISYREFVK